MQTNLILRGDVELSGMVKPHSEGYLLGLPMMQNAGETQGWDEEADHGHDPPDRPEQAAEEKEDCWSGRAEHLVCADRFQVEGDAGLHAPEDGESEQSHRWYSKKRGLFKQGLQASCGGGAGGGH